MNSTVSKLPKWVEWGAFLLSSIAGYINAIGFLSFEHQSVSHLTGTATQVGISLLNLSSSHAIFLLGILLSFLAGAVLAGYLLHGSKLKLGRHYDTALYFESLLLFMSFYFLSQGSIAGHFLASTACGLQNSLATTYSGAIIRTTHLTGIFTDLGIIIGSRLRGEGADTRRIRLFLIIIVAFLLGSTAGAYLYQMYGYRSMLLPASLCVFHGMAYNIYRIQTKPRKA